MSQALLDPLTMGALKLGAKAKFSTPSPPDAPPPVTTETKAVQEASAEAAKRRSKARGYGSTILQSFLGSNSTQAEGTKPTIGS